ncbi:MAG: hypothetical protein NTW93_10090 [Phycisphaerae bacterium]|nr:hypothetical protein [Phycisphaerae bacterium]
MLFRRFFCGYGNKAFCRSFRSNVDGLGRLVKGTEILTRFGGAPTYHLLQFSYDGLSQLVDANISNINSQLWTAGYN